MKRRIYMLKSEEIKQVLQAEQKARMIVGVTVYEDKLFVVTGDAKAKVCPLSIFHPSGDGTNPDFDDVEVIDHGHAVRFGRYEAASDAILEEAT